MFKKTVIIILGLFAIPLVSAKTLLIVGDSISAGFGIEQGKGWVALLEQRLQTQHYNYQVVNASISGDTTSNGLTRMPALLAEYKPAVVLIELGGNDGLRAIPPKQIQQNLSAMVELAKRAKAEVLLVGIELPPNYGNQYLEKFIAVFPAVAKEQQVKLVPSIVANTGGNSELMQADGVHPNTKAQPIVLEDVWKQLVALLIK